MRENLYFCRKLMIIANEKSIYTLSMEGITGYNPVGGARFCRHLVWPDWLHA
jgi:hypothetical protein